ALKESEEALRQSRDDLELRVASRTAELSLANQRLQSEIVERQRAEESLYKNHEFLEAVLENATEGIVACDSDGTLTLFNRATREFHGLPPEAVPTDEWASYYSLYRSDGTTMMQANEVPLHRALAGEHVRNVEMVISPRNTAPVAVIVNGDPLFDADGKKMGAVVLMHDVTAARLRELELQHAKDEADAANLAKSEFLSRMSHELRTPLNAILGFGQVLEMQELNPRAAEGVEHILKGGRHLLGLINEVLDIASIEAGRVDMSLEPIAIAPIVSEAMALMRPLAKQRNIELVSEILEQDELHVMADQQRFKQLLINLLSNAVKYNRENGRVVVGCTVGCIGSAPTLRVSVSDTGSGLSDADVKRLFIPFERLGAGRSAIEGTGIGLALCKRLVEAMGGAIGVESTVGEGSVFWIELPVTHSQRPAAIRNEAAALTLGNQPDCRSILYVEDNLSNLRVVEMILESVPTVQLFTAMQGSIGLDLAQQYHPDLILLDIHLPDMLGDEVLRRLHSHPATCGIPVVVLSADATPGQIERLIAAGARDYLSKPINVREFLTVVQETLCAQQDCVSL
ncbi:MAG: response regulator, partial [Chloroflexi bacterium]|nr:response regulator [Chloroflexota bacterium]